MIIDGMIILKSSSEEATYLKTMVYFGCPSKNSKKLLVPFQSLCFPENPNLGKYQELNNKNKTTLYKLVLRIQLNKKSWEHSKD